MLQQLLRKGDRVRMKMDPESRSYSKKAVPDGTLGTVMGRDRIENIFQNRYPNTSHRTPGVYAKDGLPFVWWDEYPEGADATDKEWALTSVTHLEPADVFFKEYQARYKELWPVLLPNGKTNPEFDADKTADELDNLLRTGDLPDTPFWELDEVQYERQRHRVVEIQYHPIVGGDRVRYRIEGLDENGNYDRSGYRSVTENYLTLLCRGNVWNEAHGVPPVFRTLREEVEYYTSTGRAQYVRHPNGFGSVWEMKEAMQAVRDGLGDGFFGFETAFRNVKTFHLHRFNDREIGERFRESFLKAMAFQAEIE